MEPTASASGAPHALSRLKSLASPLMVEAASLIAHGSGGRFAELLRKREADD
jgi:hypothetical protein